MSEIRLIGIKMPLIEEPASLAELILSNSEKQGVHIEDGDIIIVTSKILLKSLGKLIDLKTITPSFRARVISRFTGKNPVETEIVLRNSKRRLFIVSTSSIKKVAPLLGKNAKGCSGGC